MSAPDRPSETMIHDLIARIPYAQTLGVQPHFMGGEFTLIMPYRESNIGNPTLPALHGGGVGGFMEVCAIAQIILNNPKRQLPKPIGITVDYLRRGNPVDTYARAQIFKQGARIANVRVRAWQDQFETPIAALTGQFLMGKES